MKCPHCHADMAHLNPAGEPIIRNRGLVLKASGLSLVCPRCKGSVAPSQELQKAMANSLVLFLKAHVPEHDRHLASGKVVHVNAHDDRRPAAKSEEKLGEWQAPVRRGGVTEHRMLVAHTAGPKFRGAKKRYVRAFEVHADERNPAEFQSVGTSGYVRRHASLDEAKRHAERDPAVELARRPRGE